MIPGYIIGKLDILMKEDKIYLDETLTLKIIAEKLDITQHQLSEILNDRLGQSFTEYINISRIEESKQLLLSKKEASILEIAYESGFNSKSSFYNAFKKFAGLI